MGNSMISCGAKCFPSSHVASKSKTAKQSKIGAASGAAAAVIDDGGALVAESLATKTGQRDAAEEVLHAAAAPQVLSTGDMPAAPEELLDEFPVGRRTGSGVDGTPRGLADIGVVGADMGASRGERGTG